MNARIDYDAARVISLDAYRSSVKGELVAESASSFPDSRRRKARMALDVAVVVGAFALVLGGLAALVSAQHSSAYGTVSVLIGR